MKSHSSVTLGPKSLAQLGVSLADISLIESIGKKVGNFLRASFNDEDLLRSINEDPEVVLKRRGLIEKARMESKWSRLDFIYEGERKNNAEKGYKDEQNLSVFSWFMVATVSALDLCLSKDRLQALLIIVLSTVLDREGEVEDSLRVLLPTNIESWRSVGKVRRMNLLISRRYSLTRQKLVPGDAIPQLNPAEFQEMGSFLVWLMKGESNAFEAFSVDTFAVAAALQATGVLLRTEGQRGYETEPFVTYCDKSDPVDIGLSKHHPSEYEDPLRLRRGKRRIVQQVSYPHREPSAMIHSILVHRDILNKMETFWKLGSDAAKSFQLVGEAQLPFTAKSEIYYKLEGCDPCVNRFPPELSLLASHAFPVASQEILSALERLKAGLGTDGLQWLNMYTSLEYLDRGDSAVPSRRDEQMHPWLQYQALVFGFYYQLLEPLVAFDLVEEDTYFQGLWGY
jgi:hypothetical protein